MATNANSLAPFGKVDESKSPTVQGRSRLDAMRIHFGRKKMGDTADLPKTTFEEIKKEGNGPVMRRITALALTTAVATGGAVVKGPEAINAASNAVGNVAGQFDEPETKLQKANQEKLAAEKKAADAAAVAAGISNDPSAMVGPGSAVDLVSPEGNRIAHVSTPTPIEIPKQP